MGLTGAALAGDAFLAARAFFDLLLLASVAC